MHQVCQELQGPVVQQRVTLTQYLQDGQQQQQQQVLQQQQQGA
jgi:hypothetical protein